MAALSSYMGESDDGTLKTSNGVGEYISIEEYMTGDKVFEGYNLYLAPYLQ